MTIYKQTLIDYILLVIFIAISGVPYISSPNLLIPIFLIFMLIFTLRRKMYDKKFLIFIYLLILVTLIQIYFFAYFPVQTIIGLLLRVSIAYLIIILLDNKFIPYYINMMYVFSIISLVVYIPITIYPPLRDILLNNVVPLFDIFNFSSSVHKTMLLYNFNHSENFRNSGPIWEPGAFAGYLLLAFIFNYYSVDKEKRKKGTIILVTIFTTLSTTAYLALFIFLFFIYYKKFKNILLKMMAVFIILFSGAYIFLNVGFLGAKIESQLLRAKNVDPYLEDTNTQRFLNILRDVKDFQGYEIFGRGTNPHTRYSYDPDNQIRTVGLTDILVKFGIPFFLLMMFFLYRSIQLFLINYNQYNIVNTLGIYFSILMLLMSEVYFNYPLFWSLLFLPFIYPQKRVT